VCGQQEDALQDWMIYGANGYTGRLAAEEAVARGMRPVLAGRRVSAILPLAKSLGCPHRVFSLEDPVEVHAALEDVTAVLHCAGPFSRTSWPMLRGCLARGTHYLDITGEIDVFEAVMGAGPELARRGVVAIPGVGFDVVPTDCAAKAVAEALPEAESLEIGFFSRGSMSRGTARTALESLGRLGRARVGGRIVDVPAAWKTRDVDIEGRQRLAVSIPWGDVSTAYHSTGIGDIVTYTVMSQRVLPWLRATAHAAPVFRTEAARSVVDQLVSRAVGDPSGEPQEGAGAVVWARASSGDAIAEIRLRTPESYHFTVAAALESVRRVMEGGVRPGAHTPAMAFGAGFVGEIAGVELGVVQLTGR
jgi:saccharopine dehydrogenase (NAD+, L-lysine-forming)